MESTNSVATIHFERLEKQMKDEKQAARAQQEVVGANANAVLDEAHNYRLPIGIRKMTAKAQEDKIKRQEEALKLSQESMSNAARYFKNLEDEKRKASLASRKKGRDDMDNVPIAIQKFTLADREKKLKKEAELQELRDGPPPVSVAAEHFQKKVMESASIQLNATSITSGETFDLDH